MSGFVQRVLEVIVSLLAAVAVYWVCLQLYLGVVRRRWPLAHAPDAEVTNIELRRGYRATLLHLPAKGARVIEEPLLLCHGLGANRFNLDFDAELSLARYLAAAGHDVWLLELRGRGPRPRPRLPRGTWTFDDELRDEATLAVRTVRERTGASRLVWVGHSKGGLLGLAYAALELGAPGSLGAPGESGKPGEPCPTGDSSGSISAVVAIASPVSFAPVRHLVPFARRVRFYLSLFRVGVLPIDEWAQFVAPFAPLLIGLRYVGAVLGKPALDARRLRCAFASLASPMSRGVVLQMVRWIVDGTWQSEDGTVDYAAALARLRAPVLCIAGSHDVLAPRAAVEPTRRLASAAEVDVVELGRATGYEVDFGHGDLVVGEHAPRIVFPIVRDWLARRGTPWTDGPLSAPARISPGH